MGLTKNTIIDRAETSKVQNHYCILVRERNQTLEDRDWETT